MNRKMFASVAAGAALVTTLGVGGYSLAHASQAQTGTIPQVSATQVADPSVTAQPLTGKLRSKAAKSASTTKAQAAKNKKAQKVSPQVRADRALHHAYDRIAVYQALPSSNTPAQAGQLVDKAKALYTTALSQYQAGSYAEATATANASVHATGAAIGLVRIQLGPVTVAGLTPPPAISTDSTRIAANASKALTKLSDRIAKAQQASSSAGSDASFYLGIANSALTQAQQYVNSKDYQKALQEGHVANDAAEVVLNLAHAAAPSTSATATATAQ
ncbi:MAG: hypothetical protein H0X37_21700 [Herpetosiphonaceae bacterium]|nr:hypothetical protein [Herpetosiphonaceae bacterium]